MLEHDFFPLSSYASQPDELAKHIAKVLREGAPSKNFRLHLAMMFDPLPRKRPLFRAVVQRTATNRPKKPHNKALGLAMIEAMNAKGANEKSADVADRIGKDFGVSGRTAYATWGRQKESDAAREALQKSR